MTTLDLGSRASPAAAAPAWDFDAVYRERRPGLVRLAYLTTGSLAIAEELVQDAYVDLYRLRLVVEVPEAWLRRAVVNRGTSWIRRIRLERRHRVQHGPDPVVPAATADFMALLEPLAPRQRAAMFLRFHEDLSEQEIARVLDCRPGTVKSLISRGLGRLRETMDEGSDDDA